MLTVMEIPVTAGPWLVLGVVLGVLVPALVASTVALSRRRRPGPPAPTVPADPGGDDLPGFLESPPGSVPAPAVGSTPWPALAAPAAAPPVTSPDAVPGHSGTRYPVVAMAVTALVLVGAAAAVATARTPPRAGDEGHLGGSPEPHPTAHAGDVSAELTFEGIVLERHPVGVTVAYPRVLVTVRDGRPAAEVELPTFNCLRDTAPRDPVAAGCSRSAPEYAELAAPELTLRTDGDRLRLSGAFPTSRRPNGSPPVATGRVYELAVDVAPRDGTAARGTEQATGSLELGGERVGTGDDGRDEITYAG